MRHFSLLQTIPLSFYSKPLYRDVGRQWPGLGFGYLFLVLCFCVLPVVLWFVVQYASATLDNFPVGNNSVNLSYIIDQVPEVRVTHGEVSVNVPEPYSIRDAGGKLLVVIDTTRPPVVVLGKLSDASPLLIIGKHQTLNVRKHKGEIELRDIDPMVDNIYTAAKVRQLAEGVLPFVWLFPIFIAPFIILPFFLYGIVMMFIYGLLGKIMDFFLKTHFSYTSCVRIAAVAATPGLLLACLSYLFHFHYSGWADFAVDMCYLFYGISANKLA